ncbi:MAG: DUF1295 domain-containing protein [Hymenobacter sp.]
MRYEEMLADPSGSAAVLALRSGSTRRRPARSLFVSLPVQVAMFSTGPVGVLASIGAVLWAVGLFFESVGDRHWPPSRTFLRGGTVLPARLWRYTCHPNYFGDACVWAGLFSSRRIPGPEC